MPKICLIGAGSASFGASMIRDVLVCDDLKGGDAVLSLVDTNADALERAMTLAGKLKDHTGSQISLEQSTDRRTALVGADYVIVSVARKRMALWELDFRVPLAYGFRHILGENGGPGSVFHALRSLKLVIPICRDVQEICPDALVLSFTNPEMKVLHAISHLTKARAAGLCHGFWGAVGAIERALGRPQEEFQVTSAGINHLYAVIKVTDRKTGGDLLAEAKEKVLAAPAGEYPPLFRKMLEVFDVFTFPSDDHIGEYLSYDIEYHGVKWVYGQECRQVPLEAPPAQASPLTQFIDGTAPPPEHLLKHSGELAIPIICDIEGDRNVFREAVNVLNTGLYIQNLPAGSAVEVPAMVDGSGIHPVAVGPLPESFAAIIRPQLTIAELLTEAYRTGSRKPALQALLLEPVVDSIAAAEKLLDDMLKLQGDFLPELE